MYVEHNPQAESLVHDAVWPAHCSTVVPGPGESADTPKDPHRICHGILIPLVSGTQLLPGGRFKDQIPGHHPCKRELACREYSDH